MVGVGRCLLLLLHGWDEVRLDQLVEAGDLRVFALVHLDVLDELDDALAVRSETVAGNDLGLFVKYCYSYLYCKGM